eukprot:TRINITY_DN76348_c0_g1_i1.p1 TRINITY_DN76348_c0_g1~~TRINITY_DN76348_c0_g1_i1.p1  ORF type:complete len:614 (+),score=131.63 TRINITY_DN76348_c0_g1_i1:174-2015(+)
MPLSNSRPSRAETPRRATSGSAATNTRPSVRTTPRGAENIEARLPYKPPSRSVSPAAKRKPRADPSAHKPTTPRSAIARTAEPADVSSKPVRFRAPFTVADSPGKLGKAKEKTSQMRSKRTEALLKVGGFISDDQETEATGGSDVEVLPSDGSAAETPEDIFAMSPRRGKTNLIKEAEIHRRNAEAAARDAKEAEERVRQAEDAIREADERKRVAEEAALQAEKRQRELEEAERVAQAEKRRQAAEKAAVEAEKRLRHVEVATREAEKRRNAEVEARLAEAERRRGTAEQSARQAEALRDEYRVELKVLASSTATARMKAHSSEAAAAKAALLQQKHEEEARAAARRQVIEEAGRLRRLEAQKAKRAERALSRKLAEEAADEAQREARRKLEMLEALAATAEDRAKVATSALRVAAQKRTAAALKAEAVEMRRLAELEARVAELTSFQNVTTSPARNSPNQGTPYRSPWGEALWPSVELDNADALPCSPGADHDVGSMSPPSGSLNTSLSCASPAFQEAANETITQVAVDLIQENVHLHRLLVSQGSSAVRTMVDAEARVRSAKFLLRKDPDEWLQVMLEIVNGLRSENIALRALHSEHARVVPSGSAPRASP